MHVKVSIIVLITIISFATSTDTYNNHQQQEVSSRSNGIDRRKPGQDDQLDTFLNVPQYTGCSSCKDRDEIKSKNLETIKSQVLSRMGFQKPPNMTGRAVPHVPQHFLNDFDQSMQSDQAVYKTGPAIIEEYDDYHVKREKVITFAQQCKCFFLIKYI